MMQFEGSPAINRPQGRAGEFALLHSQRNPTALFGAGLIDAIPDDVLEAAAKVKHPGFPEVAGRVSRQKDKRIGRFGWKAQTPSLNDFVLTACAVELGLEVPGHHQGGLPQAPEVKATGLDLDRRGMRRAGSLRAEPAQAGRTGAVGRIGGARHRRRQDALRRRRLRDLPHAQARERRGDL